MSTPDHITGLEYSYLQGCKKAWPSWGAAFAAVMEYCNDKGLGEFGAPTKLGEQAMHDYELMYDR